jgi:hypothetical protein
VGGWTNCRTGAGKAGMKLLAVLLLELTSALPVEVASPVLLLLLLLLLEAPLEELMPVLLLS